MRSLKFKAQPTNAFFAAVNRMFGSSSQLPTMLSDLCSTISRQMFTVRLAVVGSWGRRPTIDTINAFVVWALNFGASMLLKGVLKFQKSLMAMVRAGYQAFLVARGVQSRDASVPLTWFPVYCVTFCRSYSCKLWLRLLRQGLLTQGKSTNIRMRSASNIAGETRCRLVEFLRLCLCSVSHPV